MSGTPREIVIESVERPGTLAGAWFGILVWCAISFGALAYGMHERRFMLILISGFFACFGVAMLVVLVWMTLGMAKYGTTRLTLLVPLPALGGRLHALISIPEEAVRAGSVEARLVCRRTYGSGDSQSVKEEWARTWRFPARRDGATALLFDLPAEAPAPLHEASGTVGSPMWQLEVSADVPGVDFSRTFDLPMLPAQAQSAAQPVAAPTPLPTQVERPAAAPRTPIVKEPAAENSAGEGLSVAMLVALNLLPIYGVVALGWKAGDIVWLYWYENLVIGAVHVLRIVVAQPTPEMTKKFSARGIEYSPGRVMFGKAALAAFFVVHYGGFCYGHAAFIAAMFGKRDPLSGYLLIALAALLVSHLISFLHNTIGRGEYRSVNLGVAMFRPYARILVVHVYIFVGGLLLMHSPAAAVVGFVAVKIAIDAYMHRRERQLLAAQ